MKPLSIVARTVCDLFAWFLVIFGVYVIVHGDVTPGGGFQGGAIVASFMALLLVAHGGKRVLDWVKLAVYWSLMFFGLLLFITLGLSGIPHGTLMYNFLSVPHDVAVNMVHGVIPLSGTIGLMDLAVGIEVAGALTIILIVMFRWMMTDVAGDSGKETGYDS